MLCQFISLWTFCSWIPHCSWMYGTVVPCLIEYYWFECVTVISLRVINSNPKSINLALALSFIKSEYAKLFVGVKLQSREEGKTGEEQDQCLFSFLPLKWTTTWPNAFIFSLTYPKFIMNLMPFLGKNKTSCTGVSWFSIIFRNLKMPQLAEITPAFSKSE